MSGANKFTVHTRLAMAENAIAELKKENAELRTHLKGALETAVNDARNILRGQIRDGKDGRDGVDGATGPQGVQGERGDVLYIGPDELFVEVKKLRRAIVERHAAYIARIVHNIEVLGRPEHQSTSYRHFRSLLQDLLRDIEALR